MKKLMTLATLAFALSGCNSPNHIEGVLALSSALNVNAQSWGSVKRTTVAAGRYKTSLAMQSDGAEVRIHTQAGRVIFSVPQIRADQRGNVNMTAAQLRQEFGLQGKIYDTRDDIDRVVSQSCVHHYDKDYQCRNEQHCVKDNAGHETCGIENVCSWVDVPVYGRENVHEQGYQDTKNVVINLVKAGKAVGRFTGGYTFNEHISSSEVVSGCSL